MIFKLFLVLVTLQVSVLLANSRLHLGSFFLCSCLSKHTRYKISVKHNKLPTHEQDCVRHQVAHNLEKLYKQHNERRYNNNYQQMRLFVLCLYFLFLVFSLHVSGLHGPIIRGIYKLLFLCYHLVHAVLC